MRTEKESLKVYTDERGHLFEVLNVTGTQFVLVTRPNVVRGNHYHENKTEWFTILCGQGYIRTRDLDTSEETTYSLSGDTPETVCIDPRVVHAVHNFGDEDLILLVQSSETFDPKNTDTYEENV